MASYTKFDDAVKSASTQTGRRKVDVLKKAIKLHPVNLVNEK